MAAALSEPLGPEQRVDEVDHEPRGHEAGERIVHANLLRDDRRRRRSRPTARRRRVRWRSWRYPTWDDPFDADRHCEPADISRGTKSSRITPAKTAQPSGVDEVPLAPYVFEMDRQATV